MVRDWMRFFFVEQRIRVLRFNRDVANASDDQVGIGFAFLNRQQVYRIRLVMRTQYQIISGALHVLDSTATILTDGVHILLALAIRLQGIVMPVNEHGSAGE